MDVVNGFVDDCDVHILEVGEGRVGVDPFLMAVLHGLEADLVGGIPEVRNWSWVHGIFSCCAEFLEVDSYICDGSEVTVHASS